MIGLNHTFVSGIARTPEHQIVAALRLVDHVQRRTLRLPLVDPSFSTVETGEGHFLQWANRVRKDARRGPLIELLLRMTGGPFLDGELFQGGVEPSIIGLPDWLQEMVRRLLVVSGHGLIGMVSPSPTGGADSPSYAGGGRTISNWLDTVAFDLALTDMEPKRSTLEVLREAETQMAGQLLLLPSAIRSAEAWLLDCSAKDLHCALLGLTEYANAMVAGLGRERAAAHYHERTGIPMSQETSAAKVPTRKRQRLFIAAPHGEQYFDMHAKPGNLTRVHIWVAPTAGSVPPVIYVGHCGRHLD
jgi:hypothetical protein